MSFLVLLWKLEHLVNPQSTSGILLLLLFEGEKLKQNEFP